MAVCLKMSVEYKKQSAPLMKNDVVIYSPRTLWRLCIATEIDFKVSAVLMARQNLLNNVAIERL